MSTTYNITKAAADLQAYDDLPPRIRAALRGKIENLSALYAVTSLRAGFTEEEILDKLRRMP